MSKELFDFPLLLGNCEVSSTLNRMHLFGEKRERECSRPQFDMLVLPFESFFSEFEKNAYFQKLKIYKYLQNF